MASGVTNIYPGLILRRKVRWSTPFRRCFGACEALKALTFVTLCGLLGVAPGIAQAAFTRILYNVITEGHFEWLRPLLVDMVLVLLFQMVDRAIGPISAANADGSSRKVYAEFLKHFWRCPTSSTPNDLLVR